MKLIIKKIPIVGSIWIWANRLIRKLIPFRESSLYWEDRYQKGGNSGAGSYGHLATFKAEVITTFIEEHKVQSVIDFGCGDGNQLLLLKGIADYLGLDVSPAAIERCRALFRDDLTKQFKLFTEYEAEKATLVLSLDVIFHLVEDEVYEAYMQGLFAASDKYVIIYSSNLDGSFQKGTAPHFRHRKFTDWVASYAPAFKLLRFIPNRFPFDGDEAGTSCSDFYVYEREKLER